MAALSLAVSFWTIGGPAQGQMEQRDRWRMSDLQVLANDVAACTSIDRTALPEALDPMSCARNPASLTDFASAVTYDRLGATIFQLCTELEFPQAITRRDLRVDGKIVCTQRETN